MDVPPRAEALDQPRILGQVGDAPQLDLVVVGDQQLAARCRDERPAELPPDLAAHGDVVEVGLVRRQPAGAGDGLVERGVDPSVVGHFGQQAVAVGRAQLLDLPVGQQVLDDACCPASFSSDEASVEKPVLVRFCGVSPSLSNRISAQLRGRVHVELGSGVVVDLLPQVVDLGVQAVTESP